MRRAMANWELLGGEIVGVPVVTTWAPNRMQVFAIGPDGDLSSLYWDGRAGTCGNRTGVSSSEVQRSRPGARIGSTCSPEPRMER